MLMASVISEGDEAEDQEHADEDREGVGVQLPGLEARTSPRRARTSTAERRSPARRSALVDDPPAAARGTP